MNTAKTLVVLLAGVSLVGCQQYITKGEFAPKMYDETPAVIVVLPAINKSTASDAKVYYATTVSEPLTNAGYYVLPTEVIDDILQQEGLYDTETMVKIPAIKFKEYFGADAILYATILEWDTEYLVLSGSVEVMAECELVSTQSGERLWFYNDKVTINTSGSNQGGGLAGLLGQIIETAINTGVQEYVPIAKEVNKTIFSTLPAGRYSKAFGKDQASKIAKKEKAD